MKNIQVLLGGEQRFQTVPVRVHGETVFRVLDMELNGIVGADNISYWTKVEANQLSNYLNKTIGI